MQTIFNERMDTKKLRQKILDLAIHGKLVPQDPNDEPASVLLERIRAEKERLIKEGKIKRTKKSAKSSDTPHYENIDFDVPSSWEIITLSEVFFMHAGKSISAADISPEPNEKYRYLCVGGNGKRGYVSSYNTVGAHPIIGRQGALCGNVNYTDGQVYATEHAVVVDTFCETEAWWAYYFLKQLNLNQYATATAQPGLSVNTIGDVQIPLPPYEEQVRIVAAIEQWYSLIDALETAKEDLQTSIEYTKSKILDLAIHGKLVPQDPNDEPAIELLKRINPSFVPCDNAHYENNTIEIPENWEWVKLSDIAISELGKTLDKGKNSGTPHNYLCAFNVKWCSFDLSVIKKILLEDEELERYRVRKGDLLICEGGDVGRAAIWESDQDIYYQNALHRVRFKDEINQYFYLYVLQYYKSLGMIDDVSGGVTIKHFTQNSMKKLSFPLPPIKEQYKIASAINQYNTILDNISVNL